MIPDLIEIKPLTGLVQADVTVPGSKSITNRALILAALGHGETRLKGALWSEDTQVMVECLQTLGFMVNVESELSESSNRSITVYGKGGLIPRGGTEAQPMELHVGNAGTAARFLSALVCLGEGVYRLSGVSRMHERPQESLFEALRSLGYRIESKGNKLPALIHGGGPRPGGVEVSIEESSQFASGLLLSSRVGRWQIEVTGDNAEQSPYVLMTSKLMDCFPTDGGEFQVEPDASSGSYFWGADLVRRELGLEGGIRVKAWPSSGWQFDQAFPDRLDFPPVLSRMRDLGDSIMTAIVLAPLTGKTVRFEDLGRLRVQECERVKALRTELTKCGARVEEVGDTLTVHPCVEALHGAEIETYGDHRVAMCFAVLGLGVAGMRVRNPSCVKKTFPDFFQKLGITPPEGLGAGILEVGTGQPLSFDSLFAE